MAKFNIGTLFGDRNLHNMLNRVDDLVTTLGKQKKPDADIKDNSSVALNQFIESLKEDQKSGESEPGNLQQLLQNITIPAQRSNRYRIYDEIYSSVQLIKSIVRVYINNTLQKDIVTGKSIVYLESSELKTDTEVTKKYKKFCQAVVKTYEIEKKLTDNILHDILRYGDHYIEIIDLKEDVIGLPGTKDMQSANSPHTGGLTSDTKMLVDSKKYDIDSTKMILETIDYIEKRTKQNGDTETGIDQKMNDCIGRVVDHIVEFDSIERSDVDINMMYPMFESIQDRSKKEKIDSFEEGDLARILLRFHSPKNIVALTTVHNNSVLGYVEVKESKKIEVTPGVGMQFASVIKQISAVSKSKSEDHGAVVRRIVNQIIAKMVKNMKLPSISTQGRSSKEVNRDYEEAIHKNLGDDLFYLVKKLYIESDPQQGDQMTKIQIRFIPTDRMIGMVRNPIEYTPYGTSIIDSLIYPGKLYLLTQLTNIVTKLSRSALIRKWTIETGPREQHTNLMNKLKRELRNQRITVDDIFKSIPKIMSDFKDVILLTKKGVKFVDVNLASFSSNAVDKTW